MRVPQIARRLASVVVAGALALTLPPTAALAQPDDLTRRIDEASRQLEKVVEEHNAAREDLAAAEERTRALADQITSLSQAVEQSRERAADLATTSLRTRGLSAFGVLLDTGAGTDLADRLLVLHHMARHEQQQLGRLRGARDRYEAARHSLAAATEHRRTLQARLAEHRERIEADLTRLRGAQQQAQVTSTAAVGAADRPAPPPLPEGPAGDLLEFAYGQLGKPYRWASAGPHGYDCSGLTKAVWASAGVALPHNSRRQWERATMIVRDDLRPGDLVFYYPDISHVALYVGNGLVLHAPTFGQQVRLDAVDYAPVTSFGRIT